MSEQASPDFESVELREGDIVLPAALYRPASQGPHPAVLVAPGGLGKADVQSYAWAGERFSAAGFVVLISTYREASPYNDADDLALALDLLESDPSVDTARIVVFAHSRGAIGALGLAARDTRISALASISAPVDITSYLSTLAGFAPGAHNAIIQFLGGTSLEKKQSYESIDGVALASSIRQPVLLIHGTADMRMPVEYGVRLQKAFQDAGHPDVTLQLVPGMGHFLELGTMGYQFDKVVELTTTWLEKTLA